MNIHRWNVERWIIMYKVFIKIKRSKEKKFKTIYRCFESTEKIMSLLDSLNCIWQVKNV